MKRKNFLIAFVLFAMLIAMCSCSTQSQTTTTIDEENMFTARDKEVGYDESTSIAISLNGSSISCSSDSVKISDKTATIKDEGVYVLSGTLDNGQIVIDSDDKSKIQLVLKNANINCDTSAAIYVKQADKVFMTLDKETNNTLSNKSDFVAIDDNNIDSVVFSKDDLTINGLGSLSVNANVGHAIVSKDDLVITGGTYNINSQSHALSGQDSVRIADGTFTINSQKDGIHAENSDDTSSGFVFIADGKFNITCATDGIDASNTVKIKSGEFNITSGSGSSNASTNSDGSTNASWGNWDKNFGGGTMPSMPDGSTGGGAMTSMPDGSTGGGAMPSMPDGSTGGGTMPSMPDGSTGGGTMPSMPDGSTGGGTMPSMPDGSGQQSSDSSTETTSAKGIKATGDLTITGGTYTLNTSDDAIHSNSNVTISDGNITISSGDDGMHADAQLLIDNGNIVINKSYEGLEGEKIDINGGDISVVASDDGLNAAGGNDQSSMANGRMGMNSFANSGNVYLKISGGKLNVNANGDGIDSNGNLYVTGGETYVSGPTNDGNGALDYGEGCSAEITGGIIVAAGSSGMAESFGNTSTQGSIMYNTSSQQEANSNITLEDSNGNVLVSYSPSKTYNSVIISTPQITVGNSYTLKMGTETQTINMTEICYSNKTSSMGGGTSDTGKHKSADMTGVPSMPSGDMAQGGTAGGTPPSKPN